MTPTATAHRPRAALLPLIMAIAGACAVPPPSGSPERVASASVPVGPTSTAGSSLGTPAVVCRDREVDWSILPTVGEHYRKAWNERDAAARLAVLEQAWADDGSFVDSSLELPVVGRDSLSALIGNFHIARAGVYFEPLPWVEGDGHHGHLRMPWRLCNAAGEVLLEGEDIAVLDAAGRIREATGFFAAP